MPNFYRRSSAPYSSNSKNPYKLSRSKIELFLECPRCFYLDRKLGVVRPDSPPYTLNNMVDLLLKNEFDLLRENGESHALMKKYQIEAIPYRHPDLAVWRDDIRTYTGASTIHFKTNLQICGIVDDIWINKAGELIIVDYKATSTTKTLSLEDEYKQAYKRQMEIYQWIFRQNGFKVAKVGYFVFANTVKNRPKFDGKLEFELSILPHAGETGWIEETLVKIKETLDDSKIPPAKPTCKYCNYRKAALRQLSINDNLGFH